MLLFERQRHDFGQTFDIFSYSILAMGTQGAQQSFPGKNLEVCVGVGSDRY